ncbi:4-hydroxy-tetrahydrodipicolinate synthase [Conyzicola lurida]|uniref:4-hydroxy-tetrahydrodipicolinate synthase n=1 Tax=Conyzicola lurida TaxID=1172621 RepID=A0A841AT41_9MICO|nr:dihydrodipicolinate synthase family protein [Conyzicola lurida]MBB5844755.1 4-hydroxy-tetrahydrodipicolinate synthase [Conyzicola lurida]
MTALPAGAWPVMLTPLSDDLTIDWAVVDGYTDWLIRQGAAGLFPGALSGEMFDLSEEERLALAARVVARAAGRVPVIAAVADSGSADEQARAAARLAATGVDAVVLIASVLVDADASETELRARLERILDANPGVDFGIYECPLPYHRLFSTDLIAWIADTGRFSFFKETSHDVAVMAERVAAAEGTPLRVFNAGIESLVESVAVGVHGLSGWVVNVYPDTVAWLCANPDDERAPAVQAALVAQESAMAPAYPNSAKALVARRSGLDFRPISRWRPAEIDADALAALDAGFAALGLPGTAERRPAASDRS